MKLTLHTISIPILTLLALCAFCGCQKAREVEVGKARIGEIHESFSEPARTRLATVYHIATPIEGRIERIEYDPGDIVKKGQQLIKYDTVPLEQAVVEARAAVDEIQAALAVLDDNRLEDTALEETRAVVQATNEALNAADKQVEAQQILADHLEKRLAENEELFTNDALPKQQLDDSRLSAETATIQLREKEFDRAALKAMMVAVKTGPEFVLRWLEREQLQRVEHVNQSAQAQARLALAEHRLALANVQSPIDGIILERLDDGDRALPAGQVVLRIGNFADLEVISDVLTADAMRLVPGAKVELSPNTQTTPIKCHVKRIEPQGFTKLSSLGVEQQRVNIIVSLDEQPENLGVGYRLQARFFVGSKENAVIIPRYSVMQNPDGSFYVYRIVNGRCVKSPVEIGLESDLELEIIKGIDASDTFILQPDATMQDGEKITPRT